MRIRLALVALAAFSAVAVGAQQPPDRSKRPEPGPPPKFTVPPIERIALSNGLPVWLVELHAVPVVEVSLLVRTGAGVETPDRAGLASLTAALLDEGAGTRSALDIADEVDFLGATLTTGASFDGSAIRLYVPTARLDPSLAVMADVALRPTFPPRDIDRVREERLTALEQARDDPAWVASAAFSRLLFGAADRSGSPITGSDRSLRAIAQSDLAEFHRSYYRADNSVLIVVGDFTRPTIAAMLESHFGAWKAPGTAVVPLPPTRSGRERRRIVLVDRPGAVQSEVRIGCIAAQRTSPDFFSLEVLNSVLGGAYTSRLNQNIREEHKYTYGAFSEFAFRRQPGPFVASAAVETPRTADALREFFREIGRIHQPVPTDELERQKRYVGLSFPAEFETTDDLTIKLEELATYDLPLDYFNSYTDRIRAVSASAVERAANAYLRPDRLLTVVVGDVAQIRGPIEDLKLGSVSVMSVGDVLDGRP